MIDRGDISVILILQVIGNDPVESEETKVEVCILAATWQLNISLKISFGKVISILRCVRITNFQLFLEASNFILMFSRRPIDEDILVLMSCLREKTVRLIICTSSRKKFYPSQNSVRCK